MVTLQFHICLKKLTLLAAWEKSNPVHCGMQVVKSVALIAALCLLATVFFSTWTLGMRKSSVLTPICHN
jgi:hypothetical protein